MLNLPVRFTRIYWNSLSTAFLLLIVGTVICFFYGFEAYGDTNPSAQIINRTFPLQKIWGTISALPQGLKLSITRRESNDKVLIPRMNNRIKQVYLAHDTDKKPLTVKPGIDEWEIQIPPINQHQPDHPQSISVIVEFKESPYLPLKPKVIQEVQNQPLILHAKDAIVHGKLLRYEPQPHKNTVGYWANENDWCEWKLNLQSPGKFKVSILQGCGKEQGGSDVKLLVDDQVLNFIIEETGHFQNFKEREIGTVKINKVGTVSLQLKVQQKARNAVMDVRQIRLTRQ